MIKVSEELLSDSVFDIEGYVSDQFVNASATEEDAFLTGNGVSKPIGILHTTGGAEVGVTAQVLQLPITGDELIDLVYSRVRRIRKSAVFVLNGHSLQ